MTHLQRLLAIAREHRTCLEEEARIDGDAVVIPIDCLASNPDRWTIEYERARNSRELLDALGY